MSGPRQFIPATPGLMKPWVLQALQAGPQERAVLLGAVDDLARKSGFKVTDLTGLKRTLLQLSRENLVTNIRKGWWGLSRNVPLTEAETPEDLTWGRKRSMRVLREIGAGTEYVYVLQFLEDVEVAQAKGSLTWKCKIGFSLNAAQRLLTDVKQTYIAKSPEVGLMIRCSNAYATEKAIQYSLRACDLWLKHSDGQEWYLTNPDEVASFYFEWFKACERMRSQGKAVI